MTDLHFYKYVQASFDYNPGELLVSFKDSRDTVSGDLYIFISGQPEGYIKCFSVKDSKIAMIPCSYVIRKQYWDKYIK